LDANSFKNNAGRCFVNTIRDIKSIQLETTTDELCQKGTGAKPTSEMTSMEIIDSLHYLMFL